MAHDFLWHQACELLGLSEEQRAAGWPDRLNIEQIVRLHYPSNEGKSRSLLSFLRRSIDSGELVPDGTKPVCIAFILGSPAPPLYSDVPLLSRDTYRAWPSRPELPEASPLHGWLREVLPAAEQESPCAQRHNDWRDAFSELDKAFYAEHGRYPAAAQAWTRLLNNPPPDYRIERTTVKGEAAVSMAGEKILTRRRFLERWNRWRDALTRIKTD